jgi:hypothetical protein
MKPRWVTVPVTQDQIGRAKKGGCYDCLVALALAEATGLIWNVWHHDARIEVLAGRKPIWKFPGDVRDLMVAFDQEWPKPAEPTSFQLPARFADPKWRKLGAARNL